MTVKEVFDGVFYWCGVYLVMNMVSVVYLKAVAALKGRANRRRMEVFIAKELRNFHASAPEKSDEYQAQEAAKKPAKSE